MSHYSIRPQLQNVWICTFCGTKYPSEQEHYLHMAGNCKDSPVSRIEEMQRQQILPRANTFSHPEDSQYYPRQDQAQGYGYLKAPNTPPQPLFQSQLQPPSRPNYPPRPEIPVSSQMQYPPAQPWDQPSSLRGYAPPHVHQEVGHSGYGVKKGRSLPEESQEGARQMRGPRPFHSTVPVQPSSGFGDGAASQQKNRRVSDSQERETHFGYNMPPNEPDVSPLAKVNSPLTPSGDKAKVTIIWKKEIPTLEKKVTYIDNIEDPVALAWSDERELFQGNSTFSQGNHNGIIFFPISGEMEEVQPFEVKKKGMAMVMVALKLAEVKSPIKLESLKLQLPSSIPKLTKNESEEVKSVPQSEKKEKGMRELLKQNQELRDKEENIRKMREKMDCLTKTIDTVEEDKQKMKKEMVKLDEQLIQVITEMSSIRIHGSSEEQKLEKENQSLKNQLELLRRKEPIDGDELLAAKEQIDQLKSHINSLEDTKLQDDRLNEKEKEGLRDQLLEQNRRISDSQDRQTHFGHNIPPNDPDISPLKVNSPLTPSGDKSKVTIIWKNEIPTLEKEVTYIDNIQEPVTLAWSDSKEFFQGNATFSQGNHTGSLFFPTSGELEEVQPFEVKKKGMTMSIVTLKLADVKSPINLKPSKDQIQLLQYKDEVMSGEKEISELRKQIHENKQGREELEKRIKTLNEDLEQQKNACEDLRGELKRLEKELEREKIDFEEISMESTKEKDKMRDKYLKMEKEKQDLRIQIDGLHILINTMKEKEINLKLDDSEKEKEKMKKDIEINKIVQLEEELKSERENSTILKQLIGKLNKENQTGEETVINLKEELNQACTRIKNLEYKLDQVYQLESENHQSDQIRGSTK